MREEELIALVATLIAGTWLLRPVMHAFAERLRGGRTPDAVRGEVQALREDVTAELADMRRDVTELAERVDFAERLLAKQREPERLSPGS